MRQNCPINYHIDALKLIDTQNGFLRAFVSREIYRNEIKFSSFHLLNATCGILYLKTKIYNAAQEPEIVDLGTV